MPDQFLPQRTLRTTFWLAAFFVIVFGLRGQATVSIGLAIGATISLASLWSLTFVVPRLVTPADPLARLWLAVVALVKLPAFALVLSIAMASPYVDQLSVFAGAASVPVVIVLKVVGYQLLERAKAPVGEEACQTSSASS